MALPKAYLTSTKNLDKILTAIQQGQAPKQFTTRFLEGLGYKSSSDRLIIGVLKALRFLDDNGRPLHRYFDYLDQTQSDRVMAEALHEAYADLYELNNKAHDLTRADLKGKMKTLTQGQYTDSVIDKMAMTFQALAKKADFEAAAAPPPPPPQEPGEDEVAEEEPKPDERVEAGRGRRRRPPVAIDGLVYNIEIVLPESRDPAVYDALFTSLRTHLLA